MIKDNKLLIYSGGLFASAAIASAVVPSGDAFCIDNRVMCAPLPYAMHDRPSGEDEPQPLTTINPFFVAASSVSSVALGSSINRAWRILGG